MVSVHDYVLCMAFQIAEGQKKLSETINKSHAVEKLEEENVSLKSEWTSIKEELKQLEGIRLKAKALQEKCDVGGHYLSLCPIFYNVCFVNLSW